MLLGSRKVVLNHTLKTLSSLPAYCSHTLPSTSPTAELYRWRSWDSETQVCKRALNRTQILSLPFPKSVSSVNPALSRVMFLQCYFSWIFITSEVLCQYSIQRPCSTPEAHRMGQFFFWKLTLRPHLTGAVASGENFRSLGPSGGLWNLNLWARAIEENTNVNRTDGNTMRWGNSSAEWEEKGMSGRGTLCSLSDY